MRVLSMISRAILCAATIRFIACSAASDGRACDHNDEQNPLGVPQLSTRKMITEFDNMDGVLICYANWGAFEVPMEFIKHVAQNGNIYILVRKHHLEKVKDIFKAPEYSEVQDSIFLIDCHDLTEGRKLASMTEWTRDYGPWFVRDEENTLQLVDHEYYQYKKPETNSSYLRFVNKVNSHLAKIWDIPYKRSGVHNDGGNMMIDSNGVGVTTNMIYDYKSGGLIQNPDEEVTTLVKQDYKVFYGADEMITFADPDGKDSIRHIDCWAKCLPDNKILVSSHEKYDEAAKCLSENYDYEVIRIDTTGKKDEGKETYTNSLIFNNTVYVPIRSTRTCEIEGFETKYAQQFIKCPDFKKQSVKTQEQRDLDAKAIKAYEDAMPGYEIVPVKHPLDQYGEWLPTDALHCRTREIPEGVVPDEWKSKNSVSALLRIDAQKREHKRQTKMLRAKKRQGHVDRFTYLREMAELHRKESGMKLAIPVF